MQTLRIDTGHGEVSGEVLRPERASALLVLAHGAGAGFRHATMLALSDALAARRIATLRFNFPFMEAGRRRVDGPAVAVASIAAACRAGRGQAGDLPQFLGGHSFGGRMASHALAQGAVAPGALVLLSFPLHPANRPGVERAAHLAAVPVPMLFLSGTRDALAQRDLLERALRALGERARLHWLEDADHGYRARKRVRQDPRPVLEEIAEEVEAFLSPLS